MKRHSPLIFTIIIFIGSLLSGPLFGARPSTPPPGYEEAIACDDEKEDEAPGKHNGWSKLVDEEIPPVLQQFRSLCPPCSPGDSVLHVTPEAIVFRQNSQLFLYDQSSKKVAAADPFVTPNYEAFCYLPQGGTKITMARLADRCVFNIERSDGSRTIVPSRVESSRKLYAVDLSPDAKLLAYYAHCFYELEKRDRATAIVIETATGGEVTRLKYPIGYLSFLSNNFLHTSSHIYDIQNNVWHKAPADNLINRIGLDSDHYAAVEKQPDESRKIHFMKTVDGSFENDVNCQTIQTTATQIKFASRTNMILANPQFMRFFRGAPAGKKLAFSCLGQITFPFANGNAVFTPLSPDSAFVTHEGGVRLVTEKDLKPLTAEQKADHFDLNT
jgi:hypothetical protein